MSFACVPPPPWLPRAHSRTASAISAPRSHAHVRPCPPRCPPRVRVAQANDSQGYIGYGTGNFDGQVRAGCSRLCACSHTCGLCAALDLRGGERSGICKAAVTGREGFREETGYGGDGGEPVVTMRLRARGTMGTIGRGWVMR